LTGSPLSNEVGFSFVVVVVGRRVVLGTDDEVGDVVVEVASVSSPEQAAKINPSATSLTKRLRMGAMV
jgi:hypothetical protein